MNISGSEPYLSGRVYQSRENYDDKSSLEPSSAVKNNTDGQTPRGIIPAVSSIMKGETQKSDNNGSSNAGSNGNSNAGSNGNSNAGSNGSSNGSNNINNNANNNANKNGRRSFDSFDCETCKNRTYQDGSNDPGVSFKTPTKMSPDKAASAVRAHENEHVNREQAAAVREDRRVVSQSVTYHTAICPECGSSYVSGGTTRTVTKGQVEKTYGLVSEEKGKNLDAAV